MADYKSALVTGGAGFIGTHTVTALLGRGYHVRVLDNLAAPTHNGAVPAWFPKGAEFLKGDVREKKDWEAALDGVDIVVHLAAYMDSHPDRDMYFDVNAKGTQLLYDVIKEQSLPVKKVILASSQSVYGEGKYECFTDGVVYPPPRSHDQLERHEWEVNCAICGGPMATLSNNEKSELHPVSAYGESKVELERIALSGAIPSVILRYSIVHGAYQSFRHYYSGALRAFTAMALSGREIQFHEDGNQLKDFVHVSDVVNAHLLVLDDARADGQIFNVGSGTQTRLLDFAFLVAKTAGVQFRKGQAVCYRELTPRYSMMDISKLKNLGWRPQKKLEDNVRDYVEWVKSVPEAGQYFEKAEAL